MAWTTHGQHIPGTVLGTDRPTSRARCGGPKVCAACSREAAQELSLTGGMDGFEKEVLKGDNFANYPERAKQIVKKYVDDRLGHIPGVDPDPTYELYVVWFTKTLQNWKALVGTTLPNGTYFEVTHNGDKHETYLDTYYKAENVVIPD